MDIDIILPNRMALLQCSLEFHDFVLLLLRSCLGHPQIGHMLFLFVQIEVQWNLYMPTPEFPDILYHPTKMYSPEVFLLTEIKLFKYSDILLQSDTFPWSLLVLNYTDSTVYFQECTFRRQFH